MKRKLYALLWAAALLLSLSACGAGAGGSTPKGEYNTDAADSVYDTPADMPEGDMGWESGAPAPAPEESPDSGSGGVPANAKIIYTADINLETKDFDDASQALTDIVRELGGYFERRSVSQGGRRSLDCTVRVPVGNFAAFLDRAGEAAHVTSRSEYLEDVSESYYDQEARLTTQRTKLERLQELLGKAESMEDIITLESAISDTELQIEYLTGSLRKYDSQISYSTVRLCLSEVYRLSTDEEVPVTFAQRLSAAFAAGFHRGVEGLEDFVIGLAQIWVLLVILAAGALIVVLVLRSCRRRKPLARGPEAGRMPAPPEPEAKKAEKED